MQVFAGSYTLQQAKPLNIMALHSDIQQALLSAAVARHSDTLQRKATESERLGVHEYQDLRRHLDEQTFLAPIDAHTTRANIYYIRIRFMKFCREKKHGNWRQVIRPLRCSKGLIMTFLFWICETYLRPRRKRSKKKTVNQYWRDFKMLYQRCNDGQEINGNHCEEIRKYINSRLKEVFDLDDQPGSKPVMGVDDLLLGLLNIGLAIAAFSLLKMIDLI
ncbi:hypothetical protein VHEMI01668 [[Torrubiella] hemipterigena]|uniref:Uncharacterized protein n=1 Tax=[Torrubiella] hemipterigena TaxID=1531966 RepID=A0A0A1T5H0_9HYPO|nr:hypothetical protein VHEMI01668 [[Torrubiella] hemipterigena]